MSPSYTLHCLGLDKLLHVTHSRFLNKQAREDWQGKDRPLLSHSSDNYDWVPVRILGS